MKNCSAITTNRQRYTATYLPIPCPSAVAIVFRSLFLRSFLRSACYVHQIDNWYDKQPDQPHKLPENAHDFDIVGVVPASLIADCHCDQSDRANRNMQQAKAGDGVERSPKGCRTPGILKQADALAHHAHPIADVQQGEENATGCRDH